MATLLPTSGKRCTSEVSASTGSVSDGSGSRSTITSSAASTAAARVSATTATIASPTKRTVPVASRGRVIFWSTMMIGTSSGRSRSAPVTTASTPGAASASLVSTATMRPWASVERTKTTWAAPSWTMSST